MKRALEPLAQSILDLWFGALEDGKLLDPSKQELWFKKDAVFDKSLRNRFQEYIDPAYMGALDRWLLEDEGLVALVVLLDQFPRNMFCGLPRAFAYDKKALSLTLEAIHSQRFLRLPAVLAYFALLPTMHSENLEVQNCGVEAYTRLLEHTAVDQRSLIANALDYAQAHQAIIARFGYFPHRNVIIGRESTPEDLAFLQGPGSSF